MRLLIAISLLLLTSWTSSADDTASYINQSGSTMSLTISGKGAVSGTYNTALGCGVGIQRVLKGFKNGTAITFTVSFGECGSITSWVGHIQDNGDISTIWTLARGNEEWDAKLTGTSVFKVVK